MGYTDDGDRTVYSPRQTPVHMSRFLIKGAIY